MEKLPIEWTRTLYARFCTIYADKFVKDHHDKQFIQMWWEDWSIGLSGIKGEHIKTAIEHCMFNLDWPPSLPEFRRLCEKASGFPSVTEALAQAVRGDITHPIVRIAYDQVGSWAMKNDKEEVLKKKFDASYADAVAQFRKNPESGWLLLEDKRNEPEKIEPPKKLNPDEIKGFKERMGQYQQRAKADKETMQKMGHPVYEKDVICPGHPNFSKEVFDERRKYLVNLNEYEAGTLPPGDWYDRVRFLREGDAVAHLNKVGYTGKPPDEPRESKSFKGARYVKDYMRD